MAKKVEVPRAQDLWVCLSVTNWFNISIQDCLFHPSQSKWLVAFTDFHKSHDFKWGHPRSTAFTYLWSAQLGFPWPYGPWDMLEVAPGSSGRHALWHRGEPRITWITWITWDRCVFDVRHAFADVDSVNFNDLMLLALAHGFFIIFTLCSKLLVEKGLV